MEEEDSIAKMKMVDDFVEFEVFPADPDAQDLAKLLSDCVALVEPFVTKYVWHKEAFKLRQKLDRLQGTVEVGDNVEDEWFVISLLFHITDKLPVVARVADQDGEILLIEAAEVLPKWAQQPDLSDGRVFIYKNKVHLIPIASNPGQITPIPTGKPDVGSAVHTVVKYSGVTEADAAIQTVIRKRMKSYPEDWSENLHYAHVLLPVNLVKVLKKNPQLVGRAVRLFYLRDPIDLKACRLMKHFSPRDQKLVKVGVKFTKCHYAMLAKQTFNPDRRSGWTLPPPASEDHKALSLGFKLSCGFEMLMLPGNKAAREKDRLDAYVDKLKDSGYFQGQLEGSKLYNELLAQAKQHFRANNESLDLPKTDAETINQILANASGAADLTEEDLKLEPEDSEAWMELEPDSFDEMLKAHFKLKNESSADTYSTKTEDQIPSEIKKFLKNISDMSGVEEVGAKGKTGSADSEGINFDADQFENALKKVMGLELNEDNSDFDEDGDDEDDLNLDADLDPAEDELKEYYDSMKDELKGTKVKEEDNDWDQPLDVDANLLSNMLESFRNQNGLPGPASTMLEPLGFKLNKKQ